MNPITESETDFTRKNLPPLNRKAVVALNKRHLSNKQKLRNAARKAK